MTMPRLTRDERWRAVGLLDAGLSARQVARRFGCNVSTIARLLQRHEETGSVADRPRPGRARVTTPDQDRYIEMQHLRDRFRTATQTARETPGRHQPRISANTVRRRLRSRDLHARRPVRGMVLTAERRQNRARWARQHRPWTLRDWNNVLFTDESRFCQSRADGRQRVWRRQGERYAACCIQEFNRWGDAGVMVWAGISGNYRTRLVVINGNLTARRYIDEVLEPVVVPFFRDHPNVNTFQQDNARPHAARVTQDFLQNQRFAVLPWPAYSPDLSPIEHLWDQLGRRVYNRTPPPQNRQEMVTALEEERANIPQDNLRRLVRSMRRRITACLAANGGHTPY